MSPPVRSFLCLPLEEPERKCLLRVMKAPGVRWLSEDQLHLTLHFLGDVDPEKLGELDEALREAPLDREAPELSFSSWGAFPPGARGRVLWVGLGGEVAKLAKLHRQLEKLLSRCGFAVESRSYTPHITVARALRDRSLSREAREALEKGTFYGRSWRAKRFMLMKSELRPQGPRYSPLGIYELF